MKISLGILLGSTYLSRRWNPSEIFAASEPGLWVDPSAVANLNWRRNLLTFSEQFDNAVWIKSRSVVTVSGGVYKLAATAVSGTHRVYQQVAKTTTSLTRTFSVSLKAAELSNARVVVSDNTESATALVNVDLLAGTIGTAVIGLGTTVSSPSATITAESDGWYRVSLTATFDSTITNPAAWVFVLQGAAATFTGDGASGILLSKAQWEDSSVATSYQPITDLNTELRTLFPNATLFQDAAGTTPVTTPGQTVALALDRSQGLLLGPELVTNGNFSGGLTDWTSGGAIIASIVSGEAQITFAGSAALSATNWFSQADKLTSTVASYKVTFDATWVSGGVLQVASGFDVQTSISANAVKTSYSVIVKRGVSGTAISQQTLVFAGAAGAVWKIDNISVKELAGNHLVQATAASRPVYGIEPAGGRRNLLTGITTNPTDTTGLTLFGDAAAVLTVVSDTAALEGLSASATNGRVYRLNNTAGTTPAYVRFNTAITMGTDTWTLSAFARGSGTTGLDVNAGTWSGVSTAVLTTSYQRVVSTGQTSVSSNQWRIRATAGTDLYFILMQAEVGTSVTAYQSALTAFNVTEAGRANMHYLQFDGTDDWMISPTVTPGTDKAQVFAGVRKLSDAADGIVVESSTGSSVGRIQLSAPWDSGVSRYLLRSTGTIIAGTSALSTAFNAPATDVLTGIGDIAGDVATLRVDGVQVSTSSSDQGTGNYLAYPLYVGRRGGTTNPFNGRIYQLIVRFGPNLTPEKLNLTELFVGTKTGFYKPIITGIPTWQ